MTPRIPESLKWEHAGVFVIVVRDGGVEIEFTVLFDCLGRPRIRFGPFEILDIHGHHFADVGRKQVA